MALSHPFPQPKEEEVPGLKGETPQAARAAGRVGMLRSQSGCSRLPHTGRVHSDSPAEGAVAPRGDPRCLQVGALTSAPPSQERKCFSLSQDPSPRGCFLSLLMSSCYTGRKCCWPKTWLQGGLPLPCGHRIANKAL